MTDAGVWLSFMFWMMLFANDSFGPSIDHIEFFDAPFSVHFMYFICAGTTSAVNMSMYSVRLTISYSSDDSTAVRL